MFAAATNFGVKNATVTIQRWLCEARQGGDRNPYLGSRRQPRFGWEVPITLELMTDGEVIETFFGTARDMSQGGLGFKCRRPLASGTVIRITLDRTEESVLGTVRFCSEALACYHVGVEFSTCSPTSFRKSA